MARRYVIVDGRNLLWRSAEAHPGLTARLNGKRHVRTGGVYGFLVGLVAISKRHPGQIIVAWEGVAGSKNFRKSLYPDYKAKPPDKEREKRTVHVNDQQARVRRFLKIIGVPQYEGIECEADDVMGTFTRKFGKSSHTIYTMDSDLRQLVDGRVVVVTPTPRGEYRYEKPEHVVKRHGVVPELLPDYKALMGDTSDNIPGVKGVGEKTAAKLINQYGSIENVIKKAKSKKKADWPVAERFKKMIADCDSLLLYKRLTTIDCHATLKKIKPIQNEDKVRARLKKYRFKSLLADHRFGELIDLGVRY